MIDLEKEAAEIQQKALEDLKLRVRRAQNPPEAFALAFGIPLRYRSKRLVDLDQRYFDKIRAALRAVRAGHNVLIYGGIGSGKTHLAACLLWERWKATVQVGLDIWGEPALLTSPEKRMRFRATPDIISDLKAARTTWKREDDLVDQEVYYETLVLDDLGFEERSDQVRAWLSTILDRRYRAMRQTIITTNLTPKDLSDAIDDRVTSRLVETGMVLHMDGPDYRHKMAEENKQNIYTKED